MKAVILVGGEGTRLRPLTCRLPKAMAPVLNRPFLAHTLEYLRENGVDEVILACRYLMKSIEDCFADGREHGVRLRYVVEPEPLGTAGAVKNLAPFLDSSFFVFNGDIFTSLDLRKMLAYHREKGSKVTIALTPVEDPSRFGVVETDDAGKILAFKEKPRPWETTSRNINAGIYILEPEVLQYIPDGFSMFEQDLFPSMAAQGGPIFGYVFVEYWLDMGTPESYMKLHRDLLSRCGSTVIVGEGTELAPGARVEGCSVLGRACHIGEGSLIVDSILWDEVKVGCGVEIRSSIIASRCQIEDGCRLEGCTLGEEVTIGANNRLGPGIRIWAGKRLEPETIF